MKLTLNLATRSYPNRRALAGSALLVFFVLSVVLLANIIGLLTENDRQRRLSQQLTALEQTRVQDRSTPTVAYSPEALDRQRSRILLINRILEEDAFLWTKLLDRFEEVLPEGVRLNSISPRFKDGGVNLNGTVRDIPTLRMLLDRLLASEYFTDVRLTRQARLEKQDRDMRVQFNLSLIWKEAL